MKTKFVYFIVLWALLVLVQVSTILLADVTPLHVAFITTGVGTMLTLYLGLKVERNRVKQEEADKNVHNEYPTTVVNINEYRAMQGHEPLTVHDSRSYVPPSKKTPSAHLLIDGNRVQNLTTDVRLDIFVDGFSEPDDMFLSAPVPKPKMTETAFISKESHDVLDRNRSAIKAEEYEPPAKQDICKHCYRQIRGVIHTEGMSSGKMRCDPEDTQGPYGYNAESTGTECGLTCLGHP